MIHQLSNSVGNFNFNSVVYEDCEFQCHFHKNFELIYTMDGECQINAYRQVFHMKTKQILLITPNEPHSFYVPRGSKVWIGVFSQDHIQAFSEQYSNMGFSPFFCDEVAELYLEKYLFASEEMPLYVRISCLQVACTQCLLHSESMKTYFHTDVSDMIVNYIYEHFTEDISLRTTAAHLGYEYHYFSGVFHELFASDFCDFVNTCRVERACELLKETDLPLAGVSTESGFGSLRNFNRVFKTCMAMTPRDFRKRYRQPEKGIDSTRAG